jgi:hypothetical protein
LDFGIALYQSQLVACAAQEILAEYPWSLSPPTRGALAGAMKRMATIAEGKTIPKKDMKTGYTPLFHPTLMLLHFVGERIGTNDPEPIFTQLRAGSQSAVFAQQLTLTIAHLDAFTGDTLRAICGQRPEVLKSNKQVTWEKLIDLGQWESVITHLIEELVFKFGWSTISERLDSLTKDYGVDLSTVTKGQRDTLAFGAEVRHLIMHNGGHVTARFCENVPADKRQPIGEAVRVTRECADDITLAALDVAGELCAAVGRKYYGKTDGEMKGIVRPSNIPDRVELAGGKAILVQAKLPDGAQIGVILGRPRRAPKRRNKK